MLMVSLLCPAVILLICFKVLEDLMMNQTAERRLSIDELKKKAKDLLRGHDELYQRWKEQARQSQTSGSSGARQDAGHGRVTRSTV